VRGRRRRSTARRPWPARTILDGAVELGPEEKDAPQGGHRDIALWVSAPEGCAPGCRPAATSGRRRRLGGREDDGAEGEELDEVGGDLVEEGPGAEDRK
jgi:hypothetical protein